MGVIWAGRAPVSALAVQGSTTVRWRLRTTRRRLEPWLTAYVGHLRCQRWLREVG